MSDLHLFQSSKCHTPMLGCDHRKKRKEETMWMCKDCEDQVPFSDLRPSEIATGICYPCEQDWVIDPM